MPGPAPKFDPARRNARVGPVLLPAEGRKGDPPEWPLPYEPSLAELAVWNDLWRTPQAAAWERMGVGVRLEVARYAGLLVRAGLPDSFAALHGQASMLADKLGLTPKAMRTLLWQVVDNEVEEKRHRKNAADRRDELALRRRLLAGRDGDESAAG